jgi:hypothetical protein
MMRAVYMNSGVMTFLVNRHGIAYEKDLGPNNARIAAAMVAFNPGNSSMRPLSRNENSKKANTYVNNSERLCWPASMELRLVVSWFACAGRLLAI